ncbi:TonB-dependent receptor plug domain-containing protein [Bradyrhizobium betae]
MQSARRSAVTEAPKPAVSGAGAQTQAATPLNSNAVAESASRLGLTVRETPATVEVISAETMREQGYRTVSEVAQGAVGVTSGDAPGRAGGLPRCAVSPTARSIRSITASRSARRT